MGQQNKNMFVLSILHIIILIFLQFIIHSTNGSLETDSNKVLSDFIWSKIISPTSPTESRLTGKTSQSLPPSKSSSPLPLSSSSPSSSPSSSLQFTTSFTKKKLSSSSLNKLSSLSSSTSPRSLVSLSSKSKAKSSKSRSPNAPLSRRSTFSNRAHHQNGLKAEESYQMSFLTRNIVPPSSKNHAGSIHTSGMNYPQVSEHNGYTKYYQVDRPQRMNTYESNGQMKIQQTSPMGKPSYSGSENGKNYFADTFQQQETQYSANNLPAKSMYEVLPMPSYGTNRASIQSSMPFQNNRVIEMAPIQNVKPLQPMEAQIIEVMPDEQPIQVIFRSTSSRVQVRQIHTPIKIEPQEPTRTEEEPQRVIHQLVRPVIQEVLEVIQPYRRLTQEIRPVVEEIHTVVSKQSDQSSYQHQQPQHQQPQHQQSQQQPQQPQQQQQSKYQSPTQYMGQMSTLQSQSAHPSQALSASPFSSTSSNSYLPAVSQSTSDLVNALPL